MRPQYKFHGVLRLVLAIFVLWSHTFLYFFPSMEGFARLQLGNVAVASFFVLSGYLMAESGAYWYKGRALAFIANRYLRIAPAFGVAAVVSVGVHLILTSSDGVELQSLETIPDDFLTRGNIVLSMLESVFPFNAVVRKFVELPDTISYHFVRYGWAVATELLFYWTMAMHILLAPRLGERVSLTLYLLGGLACTLIGITSYSGSGLLGESHALVELAQLVPFSNHLQWAPHFMIGVVLSLLARKTATPRLARLMVLGLAIVLALLQLGLYAKGPSGNSPAPVLISYIVCAAAILLILTPLRGGFSRRIELSIGKNIDQRAGNLSYPVYLNQHALAVLSVSALSILAVDIGSISGPERVVLYLGFNGFVVLCAGLIITISDKFVGDLRNRLRGERL